MIDLDELLRINGVVIAFEYTRDGRIAAYKAQMDIANELADMIAQFCATAMMNFKTLAGWFTQSSGQNWVPQQGWLSAGDDWTVAVGGGGYRGVFVETAKADFSQLYQALVGSR